MKRDEIVIKLYEGVQTENGTDYGEPVAVTTLAQFVTDNEEMLPGEPLDESMMAAVAEIEGGAERADFAVGIGGGWALYRLEVTDCDEEVHECMGHPAGPFDPMGETVYCDGSCRPVRRVFAERDNGDGLDAAESIDDDLNAWNEGA